MKDKLDRISIKGFRSIKDLDKFVLNDINVLIGANGSGKSNFLETFKLVRANSKRALQNYIRSLGSPSSLFFNGPRETAELEFRFQFNNSAYEFKLGITQEDPPRVYFKDEMCHFELPEFEGGGWSHAPLIHSELGRVYYESQLPDVRNAPSARSIEEAVPYLMHEAINKWKIYHFHNTEINSVLRDSWEVYDCSGLHSNGENLAPFLMNLRDHGKSGEYHRFLSAIRMVIPFFGDFLFKPIEYGNGAKQVGLAWRHKKSDFVMQPYQLSDGSLRFIALIACLLQPEPPAVIIIDEPELGMHPYAIEVFADIIKTGIGSQVIMATQSPHLVSSFEPENVITVNNRGYGSEFKRMNKDELAPWLEEYVLGDLWYKNVIEASP